MNKEFVTYEQALAIKELGFDEPCFGYFDNMIIKGWLFDTNIKTETLLFAPTFSQAFRFFREKYDITSEIRNWSGTPNQWYYMIHYEGETQPWNWIENTSYEEAELACLKKLIEIVKQK